MSRSTQFHEISLPAFLVKVYTISIIKNTTKRGQIQIKYGEKASSNIGTLKEDMSIMFNK